MSKLRDVERIEGFDPEVGLLLGALAGSTRQWRNNLEEPPVDAIIWQPAPNMHSIGALILHMIDSEQYWLECFAGGKRRTPKENKLFLSKETRQYGPHWPVPPAEPIEWYYELQDRIRARSIETIRNIEPDRQFDRKDATFTFRWVLAHAVEHDAYTGGQAVLLHELWKKMGRR